MNVQHIRLPCVLVLLALGACRSTETPPAVRAEPPPPIVGGDRDAHGCIASAGYLWCERTAACERPWELAKRAGFTLEETTLRRFCSAPKP